MTAYAGPINPRPKALSPPVHRLIAALDRYHGRIPQTDLIRIMKDLTITIADVANHCVFHEKHYVRHLLHRCGHYEILCMCWQSGQRSLIHDHNESNCVVRVLEGVLTNIDYKLLPSGYIRPDGALECHAGATDARSEASIHQVANLQEPGCNLVTLHVYSPPLAHMNVFSPEKCLGPLPYYPLDFGFGGEGI